MKHRQSNKAAWDGLAVMIFIVLCLWISYPWICDPLTRSIGVEAVPETKDPELKFGTADIYMNMAFAGWLKFSAVELRQWPLSRSQHLMYPQGASMGNSFDGLLLGVIAALLSFVMPLALAYNLGLLLGVFLCGFFFYRLACRLWGRGLLSLALGGNAICLPFISQRLGYHPNLLYIWTIPVAMQLAMNLEEKPTLKRAAAWGLSLPLLALASWHLLIIGLVFVGSAALLMAGRSVRRREWGVIGRMAVGWALGMALVILIGWPMIAQSNNRVRPSLNVLAEFSMPLIQFLMPFPFSHVGQIPWVLNYQHEIHAAWEAWGGGPVISILLLVVYLRWYRAGGPRLLIGMVTLGAFVLALGPYLHVATALPWVTSIRLPLYYLVQAFPAMAMVHVPGRMALMINFMALLATGYMIQALRARYPLGPRAGRVVWPALILGIVSINALCVVSKAPYPTYANLEVPRFYQELGKTREGGAVMDLPISTYWFPHYNYFQFWHKRPLVCAVLFHDALEPRDKDFVRRDLAMKFFGEKNEGCGTEAVLREISDPAFMRGLADRKIEYVAIHPGFLKYLVLNERVAPGTVEGYARIEAAWKDRLVYEDRQMRVYRTR